MAAALAGLTGDPLFWRTNAAFGMPQKGLAVLAGWDGWLTELANASVADLDTGNGGPQPAYPTDVRQALILMRVKPLTWAWLTGDQIEVNP